MGSGASGDVKRRDMKSVNSLKALQRLSLGMNQQNQQTFHQGSQQSINKNTPNKQIGLDFLQKPTRMSLKQTTFNNYSENASAQKPDTSKSEEKVSPKKETSSADAKLVTSNTNADTAAHREPVPKAVITSEEKKEGNATPESAGKPEETPSPAPVKVYTDEEREIKNKEFLDKVNNVLEKFSVVAIKDLEEEGEPYTKEGRSILLTFAKSYFYFRIGQVPYPYIYQYRQNVARAMLAHNAITKICEIYEDGLKRRQFVKEEGNMNILFWLPLKNSMLTLLNFSDASDDVKIEIGRHSSLFAAIVQLLNEWREVHLNGTLSADQNNCLKWCLGVSHNVAAMEENVPMMRECGFIQACIPYLDSPVSTLRLSAVATLADIVNEEEAELLRTHISIFRFMIKVLKSSLTAENHKHLGWSAEELTKAIRQLARNDVNKKILVDEGCLPLLVSLVNSGTEDEIKEAINCLWVLSFKPENKMKMVQEQGLVHFLEEKFTSSGDGTLRHACHGVLWSLRDQINSPDSPVKVGEAVNSMVTKPRLQSASKSSLHQFKGHVMVSYQWGNQELIKRIVQELRAHNVPVWLDIDYMGGSTLQAMAQAVEDSAAVIIAMSQKYKDSPNTRAEAEYAFQLRKKIIPLIMQRDYKPDGWLGFILGSKLYYDFSGKYSFESRMEGLLKAVLEVKDVSDVIVAEVPTVATVKDQSFTVPAVLPPVGKSPGRPKPSDDPALTFDLNAIKKWTTDDKNKWLEKHGIKEYTKLSALQGEEIVFLHNLKLEAPEFFYRCLEGKLGYASILDLAKVSTALSDLSV